MAQTEKVICYMRSGWPQSFGRLPGAPKIPGKPAVVDLDSRAATYLRATGTAFVELNQKQFETWEADQAKLAEKRAKARAAREAKQKDTTPIKTSREKKAEKKRAGAKD